MEEVRVTIKKCDDCGSVMINNCVVEGQLHFEIGSDSRSTIQMYVPTGQVVNGLFGPMNGKKTYYPKARFCPNCGKVELYVDLQKK